MTGLPTKIEQAMREASFISVEMNQVVHGAPFRLAELPEFPDPAEKDANTNAHLASRFDLEGRYEG